MLTHCRSHQLNSDAADIPTSPKQRVIPDYPNEPAVAFEDRAYRSDRGILNSLPHGVNKKMNGESLFITGISTYLLCFIMHRDADPASAAKPPIAGEDHGNQAR